ncbi:hypothetical protein ACGFZL_02730 [Streptomyces sp. NPDC048182]|uniref:hypothetical protein n=1 Tax=Streptomyces sp. NPDC048182 TaxID=3365507 RepID=UPI0037108DBB
MTEDSALTVLDRIRAIDWDDWGAAFDHSRSRALLMREYLRRAAQWTRLYGVPDRWPFFDITESIDSAAPFDAEIREAIESLLDSMVNPGSVKRTLRGAVHLAALRDLGCVDLPELPDPYAPLLRMYERGGGFSVEQLIDLNGVSLPVWDAEASLGAEPFNVTSGATLDALDSGAEGRITYFAKIREGYPRERPSGILRRRLVGRDDTSYDEAFTRNLRWEPTEYLRLYELGHNDVDHTEISEIEAAHHIDTIFARLQGTKSAQ